MFRTVVVGVVAVVGMAVVTPSAWAENEDSTIWAGYFQAAGEDSFNTLRARWVVPEIECEPGEIRTMVAVWIGLDDVTTDSLQQTGTSSACVGDDNGQPKYLAWVEAYPEPPLELSLEVRPGDTMAANVKLKDGRFSFIIRNETLGEQVSSWAPCDLPGFAAEVMIELPTDYWLPRFDPIRFHDVQVDGKPIGQFDPERFILVREGEPRVVRAEPGELSDDGTAFEVVYHDF